AIRIRSGSSGSTAGAADREQPVASRKTASTAPISDRGGRGDRAGRRTAQLPVGAGLAGLHGIPATTATPSIRGNRRRRTGGGRAMASAELTNAAIPPEPVATPGGEPAATPGASS